MPACEGWDLGIVDSGEGAFEAVDDLVSWFGADGEADEPAGGAGVFGPVEFVVVGEHDEGAA